MEHIAAPVEQQIAALMGQIAAPMKHNHMFLVSRNTIKDMETLLDIIIVQNLKWSPRNQ